MIEGKKILIGVTAGIAAYKIPSLVRLLVKEGAEVKVILTPDAVNFVSKVALATVSKNPVLVDYIKDEDGEWNNHVELGLWADIFLISPLTANSLAKMANGLSDNLLLTTYLSARCPVFVALAMDLDMYTHPTTSRNLMQIQTDGVRVIDAKEGELASGLLGKGRMEEPEEIVHQIQSYFTEKQVLYGKKVLITAGPTQEAIDPVRFISNHSSGKMAFFLAEVFQEAGAEVTLVTGPVNLAVPSMVKSVPVKSAQSMLEACEKHHKFSDIVIFAAAVADYSPKEIAKQKIKKAGSEMTIELIKTPDIALLLGKEKKKNQIHIGFALETENEAFNAKNKLQKKNFDLIVLNSLQDAGAGFRYDTNKIQVFHKDGHSMQYPLKSKIEVARDILRETLKHL